MISGTELERASAENGVVSVTFRDVAAKTTRTIREIFRPFDPEDEALLVSHGGTGKSTTIIVRGRAIPEGSQWQHASFYLRRINRETGVVDEIGLSGVGRRNFRGNSLPERTLIEFQTELLDGSISPYQIPEGFWSKQVQPVPIYIAQVVHSPLPALI